MPRLDCFLATKRLFKNGRNRCEFRIELSGDEAIMRKEGERLIIEPLPPKSLLGLLETLSPLVKVLTLVTDNEHEFSRVKQLSIENWLRSS